MSDYLHALKAAYLHTLRMRLYCWLHRHNPTPYTMHGYVYCTRCNGKRRTPKRWWQVRW